MFKNCKIVSKNTDADAYHASKDQVARGHKDYRMSPSAIKEFMACPSRWVRGYESPETSAKKFGSILDALVLTPDSFKEKVFIKPDTYVNSDGDVKPWSGNSNACKAILADNAGRLAITSEEMNEYSAAAKRLTDDPIISDLLAQSDKQVLVRGEWHDEETGLVIPVECLIDIFPREDSEFFKCAGDMKCVSAAGIQAFSRKVFQFGWHVQGSFDLDIAIAATKRDLCNWVFIGVENYAPFEPFRRMLDENYISIGRQTYQHALSMYARCLKTGKWGSYDDLPKSHPLNMGGFTLCAAEPWQEFSALQDKLENDAQQSEMEPADLIP